MNRRTILKALGAVALGVTGVPLWARRSDPMWIVKSDGPDDWRVEKFVGLTRALAERRDA